jgi:uncharacterized protein
MEAGLIIDFHTHIVAPAVRKNRQNYFYNEPGFKLLYESEKSRLAGAEDIVAVMDEQGVDRAVVFGFPWKHMDHIRENNDYVVEALRKFPDRLIGFCCVDPSQNTAVDEVRRCLEAGCTGVGELAFYEKGLDKAAVDALDPIMSVCREKNCLALIHTNEPVGHVYPGKASMTLSQIYTMIQRFSENRIVLAHWGGGIFFYHLMKKQVKESFRNVWFDTAASPFLYDAGIYKTAVDIIGPDKILFGTDYPLLPPSRYFKEIKAAGLSDDQIERICGGNAKKLLDLCS